MGERSTLPVVGEPFGQYQLLSEPVEVVRRLAPVEPPNILAIGRNYREHAKEMKAEVANLTSNGLRAITLHHAGSKDVQMSDINAADQLLAIAELVSEGDPDLWAEVELKAEAIKAKKLAESKAATGTTEAPSNEAKG